MSDTSEPKATLNLQRPIRAGMAPTAWRTLAGSRDCPARRSTTLPPSTQGMGQAPTTSLLIPAPPQRLERDRWDGLEGGGPRGSAQPGCHGCRRDGKAPGLRRLPSSALVHDPRALRGGCGALGERAHYAPGFPDPPLRVEHLHLGRGQRDVALGAIADLGHTLRLDPHQVGGEGRRQGIQPVVVVQPFQREAPAQ